MNLNLNLKEFIKYAKRFKWLLILIPLICVIATYFMVKTLPRQYKSEALVSTGLTSQFQDAALNAEQNMDYFKLSQQFGNLLEMIKSKNASAYFHTNLFYMTCRTPMRLLNLIPTKLKS